MTFCFIIVDQKTGNDVSVLTNYTALNYIHKHIYKQVLNDKFSVNYNDILFWRVAICCLPNEEKEEIKTSTVLNQS